MTVGRKLGIALAFWVGLAGSTPAQTAAPSPDIIDPVAMSDGDLYRQAESYRRGLGHPRDAAEAIRLYEILADRGHPRSMFRLGSFYDRGDDVPRDLDRAIDYYRGAADGGYDYALTYLARGLAEAGRNDEALATYKRAVTAGEGGAELELAIANLDGDLGDLSDVAAGFRVVDRFAEAGNEQALVALAEAYSDGRGTDVDMTRALALYREAAAKDNAFAMRRVGQHLQNGLGTEKDLDGAIDAYTKAAEMGQDYALVKLGETLAEAGRMAEARAALEQAVAKGAFRAELTLAQMHYDGALGAETDRLQGAHTLMRMAEAGDIAAGRAVLRYHEHRWTRLRGLNLQLVLDNMSRAMEAGDGWATESLLRFYREVPWLVPGAHAKAASAFAAYGHQVRDYRYLPEKLWATYDINDPLNTARMAADLVDAAEGEEFYNGLVELLRIDQNSFTNVLQRRLKAEGYYDGAVSGRFNTATVHATLRYCQDIGIYDKCIHGPLYSSTARLIARGLAG